MLIAIACVPVLAWIYLLGGHGGYWRTDQRLPISAAPADWPAVVAVVPARDEAAILPQTLPTLLGQDYPGPMRVILVDDESGDGTGEVARGLAAGFPGDRLTVIAGSQTPSGWAGKVWAMAQGLEQAGDAEYVLFTDADIGYAPGTLRKLVEGAGDRAMTSQMALLRCESRAERLLIPAFVYFFAQLYPFRRVNDPASATSAAAGGCMLVRREALVAAGGLAKISGARIDDVALGGLLRSCWLGFTSEITSLREYNGLSEVWDMVARSAYTQLRYSPAALAGTVLGLVWLYLVPPAAAIGGLALLAAGGTPWLAVAGLAAWALMAITYLPVLRLCGLSPLRSATLPLIATLYAGMTISSARRHYAGRGGEWKGRVAA